MGAIFQHRAVLLYEKIAWKALVLYVTVWLGRKRTYKNADEMKHEEINANENEQKRTKNGYCVNPSLQILTSWRRF